MPERRPRCARSAQAFPTTRRARQAAQSYDRPNRSAGYDPYQAQQPYAPPGYDPYQAQQTYQQPYQATYEQPQRLISKCTPSPWLGGACGPLSHDRRRPQSAPGGVYLLHPVAGGLVLAHHPAGMDDPHIGHLLWASRGHQANTVAFDVCTLIFCSLWRHPAVLERQPASPYRCGRCPCGSP